MILAVVGSREFDIPHATLYARHVIEAHIRRLRPELVISGGASGIDSIGIEVAQRLGVEFREYLPRFKQWDPEGFKERNILIASVCDVLLCIRCSESDSYGSGWTADYAQRIGKKVIRKQL